MATHSSILAWEIPGTEESGRLESMGSYRATERLNYHIVDDKLILPREDKP